MNSPGPGDFISYITCGQKNCFGTCGARERNFCQEPSHFSKDFLKDFFPDLFYEIGHEIPDEIPDEIDYEISPKKRHEEITVENNLIGKIIPIASFHNC